MKRRLNLNTTEDGFTLHELWVTIGVGFIIFTAHSLKSQKKKKENKYEINKVNEREIVLKPQS